MNKRYIKVDIPLEGDIIIEGVGFSGPECEKATRALEEALGKVVSREKKPDFYRRVENTQQIG
jgi:hypothetical protein